MKALIVRSFNYSVKLLISLIVGVIICIGCGGGDDDDPEPQVTTADIVSLSPDSPANLKYYETGSNDRVSVTFSYSVKETEGVRIFIKPVASAGGQGSIHYSPSSLFKGNGSKTVFISVESNQASVLVDKIEIKIKSADQSETISETFEDVSFTFSN
jgi:hypothetical protein